MHRTLPAVALVTLLMGMGAPSEAAAPPHWSHVGPTVVAGALAQVGAVDGCAVISGKDRLTLQCAEATIEVRAAEAPSLDAVLAAQLERFREAGAKAVMLGSPACNLDDGPLPCSFVEARVEAGRLGTAYVAAGGRGDRGFTVRCVYMSADRELEHRDPVCSALLDRG